MSSHKANKKQTGCSKLIPLFHNNFIPVRSLLEIVTVIVQEACSRVTLLDIDRTVILQESGIELHLVQDLIFQLHTSWSNSAVWERCQIRHLPQSEFLLSPVARQLLFQECTFWEARKACQKLINQKPQKNPYASCWYIGECIWFSVGRSVTNSFSKHS